MQNILELSKQNQRRAYEVIEESGVFSAWQSIGAEVQIVGSLRMGLLMKHRDIDLQIYTDPLIISESFSVISKLAENPAFKEVIYRNMISPTEDYLEWHAYYLDKNNALWQLDMIHFLKGSKYYGYFENVADRIKAVLTEETKNTILRLKYETPENEKILGLEYYQAVIKDNVQTYQDFTEWRKNHNIDEIATWVP
ncbi:MAG: phosphoglycerate mutase family protein [Bdellovibrionota bacterium]|jgi:hypothetical protein